MAPGLADIAPQKTQKWCHNRDHCFAHEFQQHSSYGPCLLQIVPAGRVDLLEAPLATGPNLKMASPPSYFQDSCTLHEEYKTPIGDGGAHFDVAGGADSAKTTAHVNSVCHMDAAWQELRQPSNDTETLPLSKAIGAMTQDPLCHLAALVFHFRHGYQLQKEVAVDSQAQMVVAYVARATVVVVGQYHRASPKIEKYHLVVAPYHCSITWIKCVIRVVSKRHRRHIVVHRLIWLLFWWCKPKAGRAERVIVSRLTFHRWLAHGCGRSFKLWPLQFGAHLQHL